MSRQAELFCSGRAATSINDLPTEMLEFYGSMITMDDVQRVAVEVPERMKQMGAATRSETPLLPRSAPRAARPSRALRGALSTATAGRWSSGTATRGRPGSR